MTRSFPINTQKNRGLPINAHPGAFGNARKYNFHEGIDLYGKEGDWVFAIEDGEVVRYEQFTGPKVGHDWWLTTHAITVKSGDHYWVYGELKSDIAVGTMVKAGQKIGELVPVLPLEKIRPDLPKHSNVMLHLEKWNNKFDWEKGWTAWTTREDRPEWLEDPTVDLIDILISKHQRVEFLPL